MADNNPRQLSRRAMLRVMLATPAVLMIPAAPDLLALGQTARTTATQAPLVFTRSAAAAQASGSLSKTMQAL